MAMAAAGPQAKSVVVILPYRERRVLMQLRDDKEGIAFPGKWGFFGGGIEPGESPEGAARRELAKENRIMPPRWCLSAAASSRRSRYSLTLSAACSKSISRPWS